MGFRKKITEFTSFLEKNGEIEVNKNGSKTITIEPIKLNIFLVNSALKKIEVMTKTDIDKMVNRGDLIITMEKPKISNN